jgi:hypothetical protein
MCQVADCQTAMAQWQETANCMRNWQIQLEIRNEQLETEFGEAKL